MEEYYGTNHEEGAEAMDVEGMDRPMGETSERGLPVDAISDGQEVGGAGGEINLDHDQRQRSSGRVVKPRVVYMAEIEASQHLRGNEGGKGQRKGQGQGQDQGIFGIQVIEHFEK